MTLVSAENELQKLSKSPLGLSYSLLRLEKVFLSAMWWCLEKRWPLRTGKQKARKTSIVGMRNERKKTKPNNTISYRILKEGICTDTCNMVVLNPEWNSFVFLKSYLKSWEKTMMASRCVLLLWVTRCCLFVVDLRRVEDSTNGTVKIICGEKNLQFIPHWEILWISLLCLEEKLLNMRTMKYYSVL